jgi:hypothetical protein
MGIFRVVRSVEWGIFIVSDYDIQAKTAKNFMLKKFYYSEQSWF